MGVHDTNDVSRMLRPGDMVATKEQTAAAEAGQVACVDIQEVADRWDKQHVAHMMQTVSHTALSAVPGLPNVHNVLCRFEAWRCQDRLSYIQQLQARAPRSRLALPGNQLPPNVQPSQLQVGAAEYQECQA